MAEETSDTGRLKDEIKKKENEIKKNENEIEELKRQVEELQAQVNDHNEEVNALKEEIERLEIENGTMKKQIADLKEELESTKKKADDNEEEIKKMKLILDSFELSDDQLIVRQLCSGLQVNMCDIVLQHHFDQFVNKSAKQMEKYISTQIDDKDEQEEAMKRWEDLKKEINWDPYWVKMMYPVKNKGNKTAHPPLTEEIIQRAKTNLHNNKELSKNQGKAIDELTKMWKQTRERLSKRTSGTMAEAQDGASYQISTRQYSSTYEEKVEASPKHDSRYMKRAEDSSQTHGEPMYMKEARSIRPSYHQRRKSAPRRTNGTYQGAPQRTSLGYTRQYHSMPSRKIQRSNMVDSHERSQSTPHRSNGGIAEHTSEYNGTYASRVAGSANPRKT